MTRTTTPDRDYLAALGELTFVFAVLEWQVVYICDALRDDNYLPTTSTKTAGQVASDLLTAVRTSNRLQADVRAQFESLALRFKELVIERNDVMHARPITAPGTERTPALSRITSAGKSLIFVSIEDLATITREVDESNITANKLFYDHLR
jgi:hypothetical protein